MRTGKAPGVAKRAAGRPSALLQVQVDVDIRERARDVATAAGVSMAIYVEALIRRDQLDEAGRPEWWHELPSNISDEELPLTG